MGDYRPTKRPTLKELANAAGVSVASASYAINGNGSVGERTRAHVIDVAARIGYRQNTLARAMKTGRSGTLGMVVPDLTNPFFPSLVQSVIQAARDQGYGVFMTDTEGDESIEQAALRMLADRAVDGIIWFPVRDVDTSAGLLKSIPTVVLDRALQGFDTVVADYADGGRRAAEHLLAAGHTKIGIISGPRDILSMRERCDAAKAYIQAHGTLAFEVVNAFSIDLEPQVADALMRAGASAVFAGADIIALGVLRHLAAHGKHAPQDLSVVGFDDIAWSALGSPPLTTIDMPLQAMAVEAVNLVVSRIKQPDRAHRNVVFNTSLVERRSVAAVR